MDKNLTSSTLLLTGGTKITANEYNFIGNIRRKKVDVYGVPDLRTFCKVHHLESLFFCHARFKLHKTVLIIAVCYLIRMT